ncbi:MAG: hypothetical protein VW802_03525 [Rhodospirillaceae bacterium]
MRYLGSIVLLPIFLTACATAEYRAAWDSCKAEWFAKIPPKFEQKLVQRTRYETVPDGNVNCNTTTIGNNSSTNCTQGTRQIAIPYTAAVTVDVNKPQRTARIKACTEVKCFAQYGNAVCEKPGPQ